MEQERTALNTESWDQAIPDLGTLSNSELVQVMNRADKTAAEKVEQALPEVARAIDVVVNHFPLGGRLFYVGSGTSGRLSVLDAAECPPACNASPDMVQALMAGARDAIFEAQEGAEDEPEQGGVDLREAGAHAGDVVVGLTASGNTPLCNGRVNVGSVVRTRHYFRELQPPTSCRCFIKCGHRHGYWPGSGDGLHPLKSRDRRKDGAQHAEHGRHGGLRQDLSQSNGGYAADKTQIAQPGYTDCQSRYRCRPRTGRATPRARAGPREGRRWHASAQHLREGGR